ncbi:kinase-like protein [Aulographum hederae CBS 113979]|uniref:EKC/KEOPS complex subunit BUD32 n=1 Tax=Aulographum hederae CBS 113979 TaxID=1176131 RepID=A0A6G1GLB6_9PEZI|nr:kinase-like protein [Aulographum hederae CBS 113979]
MTDTAEEPLSFPLPLPFSASPPAAFTPLTQGAEAHVYLTSYPTTSSPAILKYRPPKLYRHPLLDRRLTRARLLAEARTLVKCRREGVDVPGVLGADWEAGWICMEVVEGGSVKAALEGWWQDVKGRKEEGSGREDEVLSDLMGRIGRAVGKLHSVGVVHGDLTTSNLMLRPAKKWNLDAAGKEERPNLEGDIVIIDFGLAMQSVQEEDKAVDLYVLERAFGSTHPWAEDMFKKVLRVYSESYKGARIVMKRLEDVRMRGRKKSMIG